MGVDFLSCNNCGDTFPDCGRYVSCECGVHWCSDGCADEDGFKEEVTYDEEDKEEYDQNSCNFCREEDFDDYELLGFLISKHNSSRIQIIEDYKEWKNNKKEGSDN